MFFFLLAEKVQFYPYSGKRRLCSFRSQLFFGVSHWWERCLTCRLRRRQRRAQSEHGAELRARNGTLPFSFSSLSTRTKVQTIKQNRQFRKFFDLFVSDVFSRYYISRARTTHKIHTVFMFSEFAEKKKRRENKNEIKLHCLGLHI